MKTLKKLSLILLTVGFFACGEGTDVVESGTYEGTVKKVEADKSEIYVETDDNKTLELYFTETTTLSQNGGTADFSALQEGQRVEVQVEKVGQRLDPISVEILQ